MDKNTPVTAIKGVGKTRAAQLERLGIRTLGDLVYYFPRAYEDRSRVFPLIEAPLGTNVATVLTVGSVPRTAKINKALTISKFKAFDESGTVEIVFFNSPFVKDVFTVGASFRFWGKLSLSKNKLQLTSPKYEPYIEGLELPPFVPIYPLTTGVSSKMLDKLILSVIDDVVSQLDEPLPDYVIKENGLMSIKEAIKEAHFPSSERTLSEALRRLAFDEMLIFGLNISLAKKERESTSGIPFSPCSLKPITDSLPYELTSSQKNAVNDVYRDTVIGDGNGNVSSMARIIVGDVGSGKTVCAVMSAYICIRSGYQVALMAPTEILARQHYEDINKMLTPHGIKTELLLGQTTAREKNRIYESVRTGGCDFVIGTHALLSDKLSFNKLGLIITDEQHRFGVVQRALLKERSSAAHLLVMSATPIPRTLALAMYGDLDVSRITELPKGRIKVDTYVVDEAYRARLNDFIRKQVALGGQCYVICPAIDEASDDEEGLVPTSISAPFSIDTASSPVKNVTLYQDELKAALPELRIAALHGKMKAAEKDSVMSLFAKGEIDVLVSTTVIEVGINVPNASLMVVENAERFGLSQLHQLRGRVGRGTRRSYCVLVSGTDSLKSRERLNVMKSTSDGFEIAERDLMLRGPGDVFSQNSDNNMRQSGGFEFKFAKLCDDPGLMETAFAVSKRIAESDPALERIENAPLKKIVNDMAKSLIPYVS